MILRIASRPSIGVDRSETIQRRRGRIKPRGRRASPFRTDKPPRAGAGAH